MILKTKRRKLTKLERSDYAIGYLFMAPSIIYLLFWTIFPILIAFIISFTNYDMLRHDILDPFNGKIKFVGIDNYIMALKNPIFQKAVWQTMYYALGAVVFTTFGGLILALIAHNSKGKNFFRVAYYIPTVTAIAALVIIFDGMFRPATPVTDFLSFFGIPAVQWREDPMFTMPLAILMSVWSGAGYAMLIYLAGLQEIPNDVYEAASLDGAPRIKQFLYITFPLLNNKTFFLMATGFIGALQVYDIVQMLSEYGDAPSTGGANGSLWTVVYYVYYVGWTQSKMGRAAAISFLLLLIIIAFTFIQRKIFKDQTY
ncbi:MAG TPA: sugar ABC transporter permease [Pseudoneobacillus sp.]|nr:sugar ABC transporter permease [Pseudoneobacillus sp.]